jgi:geranyl-CoA carboxylase alpha subunit
MLAKIVAFGHTREEARRRLVQALEDTVALGTTTSRAFLLQALNHPVFVAGKATTSFISKHLEELRVPQPETAHLALSAVLWFEESARRQGLDPGCAWSSSGAIAWPLALSVEELVTKCSLTVLRPDRYRIEFDNGSLEVAIHARGDGVAWFSADRQEQRVDFLVVDGVLHLKCGAVDLASRDVIFDPPSNFDALKGSDGGLRSPTSGKVVSVLVRVGDRVAKGQQLVVVEAMKMQHELVAQHDGTVVGVAVKQGEQVAARQMLVVLQFEG